MKDEIQTIKENKGDTDIKQLIYTIRDKQVMLDSDIAFYFGVTTGNLNKQMKRNIKRFPEDFCFQLTSVEYSSLLFQNGISNKKGGRRTLPYVYTEQGIITLVEYFKKQSIDILELSKYTKYSPSKAVKNMMRSGVIYEVVRE